MKKAVILAGGRGTRLAPYTTVLPKPLMPVGEMPILEIVIRQLRKHGIGDLTICVGHLGSLLEAYFQDGSKWDVKIRYSYEDRPLGTAGPVAQVGGLDEPFLVMNGDLLTTVPYSDLFSFHQGHGQDVTIGLFKKTVKIDLGVVELKADRSLDRYIEKPELEHWVSMGIYVFSPSVVDSVQEFSDADGRLDLPDLMQKLVDRGGKVMGYQGEFEWLDIGRLEDYREASERFEQNRRVFLPE